MNIEWYEWLLPILLWWAPLTAFTTVRLITLEATRRTDSQLDHASWATARARLDTLQMRSARLVELSQAAALERETERLDQDAADELRKQIADLAEAITAMRDAAKANAEEAEEASRKRDRAAVRVTILVGVIGLVGGVVASLIFFFLSQ
jgi:cysteinyl-tRNA synthetase